ncbi:MAG TPA: hypothetical protein VGL56_04680 [Fimbriimonadaceae bacterium]|jgi:hypothetical protein
MAQEPFLYPHSHAPFDPAVFQSPPSEYRGAPLWSWNCKLEMPQLLKQIEDMRGMGLGGFHIHPRTGLATEYMGPEFMDAVRACVTKAKELGMRCYLYDEDRWPSGFAGGLVTENREYSVKHLRWTCVPYGSCTQDPYSFWPARLEDGRLLATYDVVLKGGFLDGYKRLEPGETAKGRIWYAYLERAPDNAWYNGKTYVDSLNPDAIKRFLEVTHERYAAAIGEEFGKVVPSIFTDEPQFAIKFVFASPDDEKDLTIPFTGDLYESYFACYNSRLEDHLPELFWELPSGFSLSRYRYHDHICERFTAAFADQVGAWCAEHGINLTGHMMEESTLEKQATVLSEAMRSYRGFQLPGIDMLCDWWELNTAKQAQSASRQFGREGVLSELYGVTNWDFDFAGHKRQGDWQAALGVTLRVHHLTWVSMAGEAKRDYPASIGYQSPWFAEYPLVENHFARLGSVLTRGKPVCRVAVIHPVESYWLAFGPKSQTSSLREELESHFTELAEWLLHGLMDFDFVCESLLPSQIGGPGDKFIVGEMAYDVVILPGLKTVRSSTLDALSGFSGKVLVLDAAPELVDAVPSARASSFGWPVVPFSRARILSELADVREVEAFTPKGVPPEKLLYQLRQEGQTQYLFVCNTDRYQSCPDVKLRIRGEWKLTLLETVTGETQELPANYESGWTTIQHDFPAHGSLLLQLDPGRSELAVPQEPTYTEYIRLTEPMKITLSEPNVLLLDQARYRIGDGEWNEPEETLRIENIVQKQLGLTVNDGEICQPWADKEPKPVLTTVELEFKIETRIEIQKSLLAMEAVEGQRVFLDDLETNQEPEGYFVDEAIKANALPTLKVGLHKLRMQVPFTRTTTLEWCYLLGDFGVVVQGRTAYITEPVTQLHYGAWTTQGLPFYAGNVTYHCEFEAQNGSYKLECSHFKAPLLTARLNENIRKSPSPCAPAEGEGLGWGSSEHKIAFAPFEADLGQLSGRQRLDITAYGSRINAFGQLHNIDPNLTWFGPGSWRSSGSEYAYEYQLKPCGILSAPIVYQKLQQLSN